MPSPQQVLEHLTHLANEGRTLGLFWHLATLVGLGFVLARRWRGRASIAIVTALPLFTASLLAFSDGNVVTGVALDVCGLALIVIARKFAGTRTEPGRTIPLFAGAVTVIYALTYTHFTAVSGWTDLWFTPVGVLPCPTLALVSGIGLMAGGFRSRAWSLTASLFGLVYSLYGVLQLGVMLDVGLLAASVVLAMQGALLSPPVRRTGLSPRAA